VKRGNSDYAQLHAFFIRGSINIKEYGLNKVNLIGEAFCSYSKSVRNVGNLVVFSFQLRFQSLQVGEYTVVLPSDPVIISVFSLFKSS